MVFQNEKSFENHIRGIIRSEIAVRHSGLEVLKYKGVADIIICRQTPAPEAVFFIEVKYSKGENGIAVSEKIQSEVLSEMPPYISDHFMWLIGSDRHGGQYWLLNSLELTEYAKVAHLNKENNIKLCIFQRHQGLTESELIKQLREWLRQP